MQGDIEEIGDDATDDSVSLKKQTRNIRRFFRIGGAILIATGIVVTIIAITGGLGTIPIIAGGYLIGCGGLNLVIKI